MTPAIWRLRWSIWQRFFSSLQSGYFKSILLNPNATTASTTTSSMSSVTLPTVPAEYFAILLSGMNSGSYNVTSENVYQVKNKVHISLSLNVDLNLIDLLSRLPSSIAFDCSTTSDTINMAMEKVECSASIQSYLIYNQSKTVDSFNSCDWTKRLNFCSLF